MASQGGQQFRGVIPGGIDGAIAYRVEVTDLAGNTGVTQTIDYAQGSTGTVAWEQLDCGTPGVYGRPYLTGGGPLTAGSTAVLDLTDAAPDATAGVFLSAVSTPAPFKGGTLYAFPGLLVFLTTDSGGQVYLALPWPAGLPTGAQLFWQYAVQDVTALGGVSISNALVSTTP